MCLNEIKEIYKEPRKGEITVYKVFDIQRNVVGGENYGFLAMRPYNKWLHEKIFRNSGDKLKRFIRIDSEERYPFGFHGFATYKGVLSWNNGKKSGIRKCKFRNVVVKGIQDKHVCLIAKEMKILRGKI